MHISSRVPRLALQTDGSAWMHGLLKRFRTYIYVLYKCFISLVTSENRKRRNFFKSSLTTANIHTNKIGNLDGGHGYPSEAVLNVHAFDQAMKETSEETEKGIHSLC